MSQGQYYLPWVISIAKYSIHLNSLPFSVPASIQFASNMFAPVLSRQITREQRVANNQYSLLIENQSSHKPEVGLRMPAFRWALGILLELQLISLLHRSVPLEKWILWRVDSTVLYSTEVPVLSRFHSPGVFQSETGSPFHSTSTHRPSNPK